MAEKEYIEREAAIATRNRSCDRNCAECDFAIDGDSWCEGEVFVVDLLRIPAADVRPVPEGGIGEMSDGYHTFNGLYYQRMVLFAALVKTYKDKAWKSLRHEDGELCFGGGWFIVGIDTPQGSYTYHYEDKDWSWFECEELPVAKHWDGHTEEDVTRLLSLHDAQPRWIPVTERLPEEYVNVLCYYEYYRYGEYNCMFRTIDRGYYGNGIWGGEAGQGHKNKVLAWMPLPEPPKEET